MSQFTVNSIVARFSDTHSINRKVLIISALMMGAISFSIYFIFIIFGCLLLYTRFQGLFAPMPQLYASARESINVSSSRNNAKFANTVLRSMFWFLIWSVNRSVFNSIYGISLDFWRHRLYIIIHTYFTNLLL